MKCDYLIFLSFVLLFGLLLGCCNKEDENGGAIIADLNIPDLNDFDQRECYSYLDTLCILNDSAYQAAFNFYTPSSKCKAISRPYVDFNKYSILIYKKFEGGNVRFYRHVTIDTIARIVTYRISNENCFCPDKCETESFNIILIPKISKDYRVEYN
jgi:hypothetical protein